MISAWLSKLPTIVAPASWAGVDWALSKTQIAHSQAKEGQKERQVIQAGQDTSPNLGAKSLWEKLMHRVKAAVPFGGSPSRTQAGQPFLIPEQKSWRERIETYAESPFERELFSMKKRPSEYVVSKAWADGLKSKDPLVRDSALTLLKAYLTYTDRANLIELSAHSQMKLVMFASHLTEGGLAKTLLYEAILTLPLPHLLEFAGALKKDFTAFPAVAQALILKQLATRRKKLEKEPGLSEDDGVAFKKLFKCLVIAFYTAEQDSIEQTFEQQEKIRLGFLKIQPVEEFYQKSLEEIERRYRLKLRQLKKSRSQKIAEAEEEKLRRIELIYDGVEGDLLLGLKEMNLDMEKLLAV